MKFYSLQICPHTLMEFWTYLVFKKNGIYVKPPYMGGGGDGGFSLEPCSSKSLFQNFHHLDHQFPANASSKTLQFSVQIACLNPFENFTYGSSMNLDVYDLKPFVENVEMADNFPTNNVGEGGGGGYLLQHHHQRAATEASIAAEMVGQVGFNWGRMVGQVGFKPVNFLISDEVSCITGENRLYKKISMNSDKNRVSPTPQKTQR